MRYCPICEQKFTVDVLECPQDRVRTLRVRLGMEKYIGAVLDRRWRLERLIGEGGMGAVFEASQVSVERTVAVKLIRGDYAREEIVVSRFYREARIMSDLQHPNIIKLLDFGQDEATEDLYLVMELLRGRSLSAMLSDREQLSLEDVLQLTEQLAAALMEAHSRGIVHRDLKPDNIFIQRVSGRGLHLTLIDFGIARVEDGGMGRLTRTGAIQGTPTYMAPEQAQGESTTASVDLYALGIILFEILARQEPFKGESLMQVLMAHMATPPPDLTVLWALDEPVCAPLVHLVARLLAKTPEGRPESALAVLQEAQAISAQLATGVAMSEATVEVTVEQRALELPPAAEAWSLDLSAAGSAPLALPYTPASAAGRSRSGLLIGVSALLVLGVAAAVLLIFLLADSPPSPSEHAITAPSAPIPQPEIAATAAPSAPVRPASQAPPAALERALEERTRPVRRRASVVVERPATQAPPPASVAAPATAAPAKPPRDTTLEDTLGKMRRP